MKKDLELIIVGIGGHARVVAYTSIQDVIVIRALEKENK